MKTILNWRLWVLCTLLAIGFFAVILIFGDDERPMRQWIEARICLALVAAACFYPLCRLTKKWEGEGKLSEYTNQKYK